MAIAASGSAVEDAVSIALQLSEGSGIIRPEESLKAAFGANQGALVGGKCPCQSVSGWGTRKREVKEGDVLGVSAQAIFGFFDRDAHLAAAKWAQRLLFEAAQSSIPHQRGHIPDIDERGRVALSASATVGDADLPSFSERIFGTVTARTRRGTRARQARVKEQLLPQSDGLAGGRWLRKIIARNRWSLPEPRCVCGIGCG